MKIYIAVKYMSQQYSGVDFPPSPLKFVQAIIASSQDKYMDVLRFLETQTPVIYAVPPAAELEYSRFVSQHGGD